MKGKINITSIAIERTGGMRAIFEIANRLHDLNYNVTITTLAGDSSWFPLKVKVNYITSVPKKILIKNIDKIVRAYRGIKGRYTSSLFFYLNRLFQLNIGMGLDLIPYLAKNIPDCDVNIATWYPTAFAVYYSGKGRPYYFLQDYPALVTEQCDYFKDYCLRMFTSTLRLPFYFITNSKYTKNMVIKFQPNAKIKIISVGVNTTTFYPYNQKILDNVKRKVMIIIRGSKIKGDEIAVKVVNALNKKLSIHLMLIGSYQNIINTFNIVKPKCTYTHYEIVNDEKLASLYSSADLFLYTSYVESFGLPPLEAMACGTPVVSTDCIGNRDYAVDGYNCLLASPGDVESLTNACLRVLTDSELANRLINGGLETAQRFTWDKVVERLEPTLKNL